MKKAKNASGSRLDEMFQSDPVLAGASDQVDLINQVAGLMKSMRTSARLTQADMADRLGVSQPRIAQLESGLPRHAPSLEHLAAYATVTGQKLQIQALPAQTSKDEDVEDVLDNMLKHARNPVLAVRNTVLADLKSPTRLVVDRERFPVDGPSDAAVKVCQVVLTEITAGELRVQDLSYVAEIDFEQISPAFRGYRNILRKHSAVSTYSFVDFVDFVQLAVRPGNEWTMGAHAGSLLVLGTDDEQSDLEEGEYLAEPPASMTVNRPPWLVNTPRSPRRK